MIPHDSDPDIDVLCADIEAGRTERRYRAWELQAKARFINGEVDAEIRNSREHPQVTAHGAHVDSDPRYGPVWGHLPPHAAAVTWGLDWGQGDESSVIAIGDGEYTHTIFSVGADDPSRLPIVYGVDFGQGFERSGIILMPDNVTHATSFAVGADEPFTLPIVYGEHPHDVIVVSGALNQPFSDVDIPPGTRIDGVTLHVGLRSMREAFERFGSEIARVGHMFSDVIDQHARQAESAYLMAHRRLPGSMKTKRLRKKRRTLLWRWYMAQHDGR